MARTTPNEKNIRFIDNLIQSNGNLTKAAIATGYSEKGACQTGRKLLDKPYIKAEYERRLALITDKTTVTIERIENEMAKIAFASSQDVFKWGKQKITLADETEIVKGVILLKTWNNITEDTLSAIASIKETNQGIEIKMYDKQRALEDLAKIKGAFNEAEVKKAKEIKDTDKLTKPHDPCEGMTEEELDKELEKLEDNPEITRLRRKGKGLETGETEPETVTSIDILRESNKIFQAVINGRLTPGQGKQLSDMLETQRKTLETVDLEKRINELEKENDN